MPCFRPLTCWQPLDGGQVQFRELRDHRELELPCGQCIGCRLQKQQMWAFRCLAEASLHSENWFLTLTYAPEHLPQYGALTHRDWQLFAKRVRKRFGPFRFLMCGEYGEQSLRPHFHALLFGLHLGDAEPSGVRRGHTLYQSERLLDCWGKGRIELGTVTPQSARYCAGYVLKDSRVPERVCDKTGEIVSLPAPYGRMSLKPGIGDGWIRRFYPEVFAHGACYADDRRMPIPGRFKDILSELDSDAFDDLSRRAIEKARSSPDTVPDRLAVREEVAWRRLAHTKEVRDNAL